MLYSYSNIRDPRKNVTFYKVYETVHFFYRVTREYVTQAPTLVVVTAVEAQEAAVYPNLAICGASVTRQASWSSIPMTKI